jgi:hypothetical protein
MGHDQWLPPDHSWTLGPEVSNTHSPAPLPDPWHTVPEVHHPHVPPAITPAEQAAAQRMAHYAPHMAAQLAARGEEDFLLLQRLQEEARRNLAATPLFPRAVMEIEAEDSAEARARARLQANRQERMVQAWKEVEALTAQIELTGYDRNVLDQWFAGGCGGRRPPLSFELKPHWKIQALMRQEAEAKAAKERERLAAARAIKRRGVMERRAAWDEAHPEAMEKRIQRKRLVKERKEREAAERQRIAAEWRAVQEREKRLREINQKARDGGKDAILRFSEDEFDLWLEVASEEQLETFGAELFRDGLKARQGDRRNFLEALRDFFRCETS